MNVVINSLSQELLRTDGVAFTSALDTILDHRVQVARQYQSMTLTGARLAHEQTERESMYRIELETAEAEIRRQHEEATQNGMNAEKYAAMTAAIGTRACQEIQERDLMCSELLTACTQYEVLASNWKSATQRVNREAESQISESMACLQSTEHQIASYKREVELANRMAASHSQAAVTL